ncbi:aldo/keto reductase [Arthrobacter sp. GMC3]|uniref:aldo/keto reductase n=1 Tax=Arthrobacter sp. GMC3 TaxID=2058894 RepID=UPI002157123B|nr:aldo/keto reductase [Arthrobacter sp. GMC3]
MATAPCRWQAQASLDHPRTGIGAISAQFTALAELQQEGLIRHLGVSTVSADQIAEAQSIAPVACVQNFYNIANRDDDELIHNLASQGIASAPDHPPSPLPGCCSRSPNMLLIPGTSSVAHLRENVAGPVLALSEADVAELNTIGA